MERRRRQRLPQSARPLEARRPGQRGRSIHHRSPLARRGDDQNRKIEERFLAETQGSQRKTKRFSDVSSLRSWLLCKNPLFLALTPDIAANRQERKEETSENLLVFLC